jgi:anti-anti-sigma factor
VDSDLASIEVVRDDAGEVVFVRGELDRASVPSVAECLREILDTAGPGRSVVVNLADTTFVDVGGLSFLFEAAGWATERGSRLYLAGCTAHLVRLLHLTDHWSALDVIPS